MELKLFFTYIGSLFIVSVVLTFLVKNMAEGYASQGSKPIWYAMIAGLVSSVIAYLSNFVSSNLFVVFWILSGLYLLFGIIHTSIVHNKYFYAGYNNRQKVFLGELLFGLSVVFFSIVVFSALQYFLKDEKDFLFYPMMMSTLCFFIPVMVYHTFEAAYNIPSAEFGVWQYPVYETIDLPPEDPNEKLLVIGFEIAKNNTDKQKTYFRAKAPEGIKLGELYYHFINDYNDAQSETPIRFVTDFNEPVKWWFRVKPKWYQANRILNPAVTIRENGIKENSVIVCERLD